MKIITVSHFKSKVLLIGYSVLLFIATICGLELMYREAEIPIEVASVSTEQQEKETEEKIIENTIQKQIEIKPKTETPKITIQEYQNMPKEIKGYKVIGKLEIPKIELSTYILSETNDKALNVSVTKLTGPNINKEGNFCITGHNYNNNRMFGKLKKLELGDKIILTDTYDRSVTYTVSSIDKVGTKEIEVLSQETMGEREVTLITCTTGAIKRIVVKAIEEYD